MSYCRWSSDWFRCDLYCYEDVSGGYTTHVASRRYTLDVPEEWGNGEHVSVEQWFERHKQVSAQIDRNKSVPIGLPHDGETFNDPDLPSFLARVESLRAMGYQVPDYVAEDIRKEIAQETDGAA